LARLVHVLQTLLGPLLQETPGDQLRTRLTHVLADAFNLPLQYSITDPTACKEMVPSVASAIGFHQLPDVANN